MKNILKIYALSSCFGSGWLCRKSRPNLTPTPNPTGDASAQPQLHPANRNPTPGPTRLLPRCQPPPTPWFPSAFHASSNLTKPGLRITRRISASELPGGHELYGIMASTIHCSPDPDIQSHSACPTLRTGKSWVEFVFYADEAHTQEVDRRTFFTGLSDEARGIPPGCEAEFRIYDGKCYVAYTCYDALGNYLYSYNNYPPNGNFQGFTGPCPGW